MDITGVLKQLKDEKARLDNAISAIEALEGSGDGGATPTPKKRGRKPMAAIQKATAAPKKRKLSAEGRAKIVAAAKARWARMKAIETTTPPTTKTKAPAKKAAKKK